MDEKLKKDYISTIGVDVTTIKVSVTQSEELITVSVWDLAGQDRYQNVRKPFFLGASAGILIFDVTNKDSFNNLENWLTEIEEMLVNPIPLILVGNKIDLPDRVVTSEQMQAFKKQKKTVFSIYETSALTGEGIKELFYSTGELIYNEYSPLALRTQAKIRSYSAKKTEKTTKNIQKSMNDNENPTTNDLTEIIKKPGKRVIKKAPKKPKTTKKTISKKTAKKE
jgi:small GTP-binding protein